MISQKKIAEHLNLGRSTVANILRGGGAQKYNEETCRAVLEAAEKFGYRPNKASRSVRLGRTNIIGVIHFGGPTEASRQAFSVLADGIKSYGYDIFVIDLSWYGGDFTRALDQLVEMRVEGVIICHMTNFLGVNEIDILRRAGIPAVSMAGNEQWNIPVVCADIIGAMHKLVDHLVQIGHRRLLLLTHQNEMRSTLNRIEGFTQAIEKNGGSILPHLRATDEVIQWPGADPCAPFTPQGRIARVNAAQHFDPGYDYTLRLIEMKALPDVILCSNDQWAQGAFTALLGAGLKIPEDVAVTGFDNDRLADFPPYYLTTVAQPIRAECEKALVLLIEQIQGRPRPEEPLLFPCELVIRKSCGHARASKGHPLAP
jgi:DNA-binding LacI/PurR family transcriptional regulator